MTDAIANAIMSLSPTSQDIIKNIVIWTFLFLVFKSKERTITEAAFIGEVFAIFVFFFHAGIIWLFGESVVSTAVYIILSAIVLFLLL